VFKMGYVLNKSFHFLACRFSVQLAEAYEDAKVISSV
jgi:hypothetical protein